MSRRLCVGISNPFCDLGFQTDLPAADILYLEATETTAIIKPIAKGLGKTCDGVAAAVGVVYLF